MDGERGNKEKTRLTYNCADLSSIEESVTFRFTEEGNYIFLQRRRKTEKGKQENIWRQKNIFGRRGTTENENEDSIWRRKYFFGRRGKTAKPNEESIWRRKRYFFVEEKKNREGK